MVDTNALRSYWVKKGMTQAEVAYKIDISPRVMSSRMKKKWFGSDEIEKLISLLDIVNPMPVFLLQK